MTRMPSSSFDPDHSEDDKRFILLGLSFELRVVVVCHCFRKSETVIRIFSARKANKHEEQLLTADHDFERVENLNTIFS